MMTSVLASTRTVSFEVGNVGAHRLKIGLHLFQPLPDHIEGNFAHAASLAYEFNNNLTLYNRHARPSRFRSGWLPARGGNSKGIGHLAAAVC
jgi:hypothetical protein